MQETFIKHSCSSPLRRGTASPSEQGVLPHSLWPDGGHGESRRFRYPAHDIHVLDLLPRRALHQVIDCRHNNHAVRARLGGEADIAVICPVHVLGRRESPVFQKDDKGSISVVLFIQRPQILSTTGQSRVGRGQNAACNRDKMRREGDGDILARDLREGLLDLRRMPMAAADSVGPDAFINLGKMII